HLEAERLPSPGGQHGEHVASLEDGHQYPLLQGTKLVVTEGALEKRGGGGEHVANQARSQRTAWCEELRPWAELRGGQAPVGRSLSISLIASAAARNAIAAQVTWRLSVTTATPAPIIPIATKTSLRRRNRLTWTGTR